MKVQCEWCSNFYDDEAQAAKCPHWGFPKSSQARTTDGKVLPGGVQSPQDIERLLRAMDKDDGAHSDGQGLPPNTLHRRRPR